MMLVNTAGASCPLRAPGADVMPFDIDAFLASLPAWGGSHEQYHQDHDRADRGSAGQRLRGHLSARVSDELLREVAGDTLGAVRCSQKYLDALRIVLGNQAHAEQLGYLLEMNTRTTFVAADNYLERSR